jgi:hypothetical protein
VTDLFTCFSIIIISRLKGMKYEDKLDLISYRPVKVKELPLGPDRCTECRQLLDVAQSNLFLG